MATLRVSTELLVDRLALDIDGDVKITGARFENECILLEIEGDNVPDAQEVHAHFTSARMTVKFEAVK